MEGKDGGARESGDQGRLVPGDFPVSPGEGGKLGTGEGKEGKVGGSRDLGQLVPGDFLLSAGEGGKLETRETRGRQGFWRH